MICDLLPAVVAASEAFDDPPEAKLFAEEEVFVAHAVDKRRREFATARLCARRALADLGVPGAPILRGEKGEPQWPPGIVGSITHCSSYRAAAVARADTVVAIGIDAEAHEPLPDDVLPSVSLASERAHLFCLHHSHPDIAWDRLLFCAKEATYKAWFPLMRKWLGSDQVEVTLDVTAKTFTSRFLVSGPFVGGTTLEAFRGSWAATDAFVAAAVTVMALPTAFGPK